MKKTVCVPEDSERIYYAQRLPLGVRVNVADNGFSYPLDGDFDWGCNNRYSLNLSRAILEDFAGEGTADSCGADFNKDFISCLPTAGFSLPGEAIAEWLRGRQLEPVIEFSEQALVRALDKEMERGQFYG